MATITVWEQDPGNGPNPDGGALLHRTAGDLEAKPFPTKILGAAPPPDNYQPGTVAFRYWNCADALRRSSDYWGRLLGNHAWNPAIGGGALPVILDEGTDLNAYYDRGALHFFHAAVGGRMVYSGESPDIVCHEFGHAMLDAIKPQLWDVAAFEVPAFHESIGDIGALLCALQQKETRVAVLHETGNRIFQSSHLSRLAEQLGWGIRQVRSDAVDRDCLRNAVNSHYYRNPNELPTSATAEELSSEPHSFSRVFTAAFFHALAGMFASQGAPTEEKLQLVSLDIGKILVDAIRKAPIVPEYFSQVGAHMIRFATAMSAGYGAAMKTAMVQHGIVSVPGVSAVFTTSPQHVATVSAAVAVSGPGEQELDVSAYGLNITKIRAVTASQPKVFGIAGAAPSVGDSASIKGELAALGFFEDLVRRGRLDDGGYADPTRGVVAPATRMKTHKLVTEGNSVVLRRIRIDCGLHGNSSNGSTAKP